MPKGIAPGTGPSKTRATQISKKQQAETDAWVADMLKQRQQASARPITDLKAVFNNLEEASRPKAVVANIPSPSRQTQVYTDRAVVQKLDVATIPSLEDKLANQMMVFPSVKSVEMSAPVKPLPAVEKTIQEPTKSKGEVLNVFKPLPPAVAMGGAGGPAPKPEPTKYSFNIAFMTRRLERKADLYDGKKNTAVGVKLLGYAIDNDTEFMGEPFVYKDYEGLYKLEDHRGKYLGIYDPDSMFLFRNVNELDKSQEAELKEGRESHEQMMTRRYGTKEQRAAKAKADEEEYERKRIQDEKEEAEWEEAQRLLEEEEKANPPPPHYLYGADDERYKASVAMTAKKPPPEDEEGEMGVIKTYNFGKQYSRGHDVKVAVYPGNEPDTEFIFNAITDEWIGVYYIKTKRLDRTAEDPTA